MAQLLVAPMLVVPVAGLLWYNKQQAAPSDRVPTTFLLTTWALSGAIGPAIAAPVQLALGLPMAKLLFGPKLKEYLREMGRNEAQIAALTPEQLARRRAVAFSWQNVSANLFMSTLAPAVEEVFKYAVLKLVERYFPEKVKTKRNYVLIAMAIGLGFAAVENLAFVRAVAGVETPAQLALSILERALAGSSGHLLTAALTGCKFADAVGEKGAKRGLWGTIRESLLYHCLGNFGLFTICTLHGNVGWIHPRSVAGIVGMVACVLSVNGAAAWRVAQELTKFDTEAAKSL